MKEISLHILDIMQNSVTAKASLVELTVIEDKEADILSVEIKDNGCGMTKEFLQSVEDPFTTARTTRKVGLGIPLIKQAAISTNGSFKIESEPGVGTKVSALFGYSHIDRQPLGNMAETMHQLVTSYEDVDFLYCHKIDGKEFLMDTRQIKEILGGVSLKENAVSLWLMEYLKENEDLISQN